MGGGITRLRNNAFTLIELLAIIVILAIIAVITVPIILNIIENSRKGAATDSAYGYKDSVNKTYITELSKPNQGGLKLNGTYEVQDDGTLEPADGYSFGVTNYNTLPVSVSGNNPSSGSLEYQNNVLKEGWLVIGDYRVTFNSDGTVTTEKNTVSNSNGNNNNSGQVEESQTPSNPYLTRFDGNYTYKDIYGEEYEELDDEWTVYLRNDGTIQEVCEVFDGGTVCLTSSYYNSNYSSAGNYGSDFEDVILGEDYFGESGLKGYAKAKADEMLSKNATCTVSIDRITCGGVVNIYSNGSVDGFDGSNDIWCNVINDGSSYCS